MNKIRMLIFLVVKRIAELAVGRGIRKFLVLKVVYNFLRRLLLKDTVLIECQGHKMYVYLRDNEVGQSLAWKGVWEETMTNLFKSIMKKDMIVCDVGSEVGYYTLIAANLVGRKGKVFAFEPNPNNYALLVKNIEINQYKNITAVQKAISNRVGTTRLFLKGASSTIGSGISNCRGEELVAVTTLDKFFEKYNNPKIDVIKIDVEGAEEEVYQGMTNIIKGNADLKIFAELWPRGLRGFGSSSESFLNKLRDSGFQVHLIDERSGLVYPIGIAEVIEICESRGWVNLFCQSS